MAARAGNLLFFPPSSSKDSGPDTTFRMLEAGLSDAGLFTMDLYPFSTKIPRMSPKLEAFVCDHTLEDDQTARDLWDILLADATAVYAIRAITSDHWLAQNKLTKVKTKRLGDSDRMFPLNISDDTQTL